MDCKLLGLIPIGTIWWGTGMTNIFLVPPKTFRGKIAAMLTPDTSLFTWARVGYFTSSVAVTRSWALFQTLDGLKGLMFEIFYIFTSMLCWLSVYYSLYDSHVKLSHPSFHHSIIIDIRNIAHHQTYFSFGRKANCITVGQIAMSTFEHCLSKHCLQ